MKMLSILNQVIESGQDSPSFRKLRYRLAILNEEIYGDPGAGLIRQLIAENPYYDKYHHAMRWMLEKNEEAVKSASELDEDCVLVKMMFDSSVDDEHFLAQLNEERTGKTSSWYTYRGYLNSIALAMP